MVRFLLSGWLCSAEIESFFDFPDPHHGHAVAVSKGIGAAITSHMFSLQVGLFEGFGDFWCSGRFIGVLQMDSPQDTIASLKTKRVRP